MVRTMRAALAASAIALGCSVVVPSSALTIDPGLFSSPSRPLQRLVPGRECSETQNVCTLRAKVNFSDGSIGSGIWAFTLPQSAYVLSIDADVTTAFNAGTTNNITIGATATGTDFLPSTSVSSAGIQHLTSAAGLGAAATGNASLQTQLNGAVPVYFRYQQSGTAATAGSVTVVISYAPAFGDKVISVAAAPTAAPVNTVLPSISGTPQVGSTLTVNQGSWTNSPTSISDQWLSNGTARTTGSSYVPVTGDIGATITVAETATNAIGSTTANSAGVGPVTSGGGSVPAFVASVCPGLPGTGMCVDLVGNQAWDGTAQATVSPASLLTDTRAGTVPYDPGTGITTTIAANTLPLGSAGLQLFQVNNMLAQSNGDYTIAGGIWSSPASVIVAPTITKNPNFGGSGCSAATTAPDGSCNTTEIVIPPGNSVSDASALQQHVTPATGSTTYTCYVWAKSKTAGATAQFYLSTQNGSSPNAEFANQFVQTEDNWKRFSVKVPLASGQTSFFFNFGNGTALSFTPIAPEATSQAGGTFEVWKSGCSPGPAPAPYVATTTAASPTVVLDNIVATGNLATALQASAGAVSVTVAGSGTDVAGTMIDDNGVVVLGRSAANNATTALGAALSAPTAGTFIKPATAYLEWSGTAGSINLNGSATSTDAVARVPGAGPFHVGTTSGTAAALDGYITAIAVYPSATAPVVASSVPITSISFGTVATIASGTLQGAAPATIVNGDSWAPTVDPAGNIWSFCDDCGYGAMTAGASGNTMLTEMSWSGGNHGFINLGGGGIAWTGGNPGLVNNFDTPLGQFATQDTAHNTWKSRGLVGIQDGSHIDMFGALDADIYGTASNTPAWIQLRRSGGVVIAVVDPATNAGTTADWLGLPTGSPPPATVTFNSPTFASTQFGAPGFVQYTTANPYCTSGSVDGTDSFVYSVSNDLAYNIGSNAYLGRIACATILTSKGGTPSAASTPSSWQFYDTANAGCSGTGTDNNCWTATLANATPVFTNANRLGALGMTYLPATHRYLMTSFYNPALNGAQANTETQLQMAGVSDFVFADCAKPWGGCTALPEVHWPRTGYYDPAVMVPSLSTDGGLTATMIFSGNFAITSGAGSPTDFSSTSVYTPTMGQVVIHY